MFVGVMVLGLMGIGIAGRMRNRFLRDTQETLVGPIAQSIGGLVSSAGGIYLAIRMLLDFLHIQMHTEILIGGQTADGMAMAALALACVQSWVTDIGQKAKRIRIFPLTFFTRIAMIKNKRK